MDKLRFHRPILYPKHFNTYGQCPEKYFHERVERRRIDQTPSVALARGIASHQVLSQIANETEAHMSAYGIKSVSDDVFERASRALPHNSYADRAAWARDVDALAAEVQYGITYLEGDPRVLATEITLQYRFVGDPSCPPFVLAAKVDAVLLRHDVVGRPYLDVVDWKGGTRVRHDPIQELACRIVVQSNARSQFSIDPAFIQNTTVYLGAKKTRSVVIAPDVGRSRWQEMLATAAAIMSEASWTPSPSPLCEWCPFFASGCSLAKEANDTNSVDDWLGAIAG